MKGKSVSDLLATVIDAHGGMERWRRVNKIVGHTMVNGALFQLKGWPRVDEKTQYVVDTRTPQTVFPDFLKAGQSGIYEPARTAIISDNGEVIEELRSPKESFEGHSVQTSWNALQLLYFSGYAQWTYMHLPFLLIKPGFETREVEPWNEGGQVWRRLEVTFPDNVSAHSKMQTFYFDDTGLLRRNDYTADVLGGSPAAHYTSEHKMFDGIVYPTKRRVYRRGPDNLPIRDVASVAIDYNELELS